uniref:Interleukin 12 receptor subunit beta 2 n=1 Tax=Pelusios castaneus TaxID=367368 RepID=A0A8C8R7C7_9SAUR
MDLFSSGFVILCSLLELILLKGVALLSSHVERKLLKNIYPPDLPRNVSCIQYGRDENPTCSWDKGRLTHIKTEYTVQLTNETQSLSFEEKMMNLKYGSLDLTKLNFESNYTAVVTASNRLGNASSLPFTFMLIDILKPHSPTDILVKCDNFSATNCTVLWQDQQQTQSFKLRYRSINRHSWNMVKTLNATRYDLHDLKPHTEYEFQICCKLHPNRGIWSDWRTFQIKTPEAGNKMSMYLEIVFNKSEARGEILYYTLTFQSLNQKSPTAADMNVVTQTHYTRVIPKMDYNIMVYAHNSKGSSPPTSIIIDLSILDLPPPRSISATPMGNDSICVIWEPPIESAALISGYIVEWAETHRDSSLEPHLNWIRFPASNLSTVISENIQHDVCYDIKVFALYRNRAGSVASTRGYLKQKAPSAGPQLSTAIKGDGVWASWEEIPGHQQMGCIISYNIYLQKKTSEAGPKVYAIHKEASRNSFLIKNLQHGVIYVLWMTASTIAGESPKGNEEFEVATFAGISRSIPDPANSTWAKKYSHVEVKPETIEVEEVFIKKELVTFKDLPIFSTIKSSESYDWQTTESSFEKPESTEKNSEYKPLAPSTPDHGDNYRTHLPYLYKKVVLEETEQSPIVSEYLANPLTDTTVNYLPSNIPSPIMDTNEDDNEFECKSFSVFPTTSFLMPMFSCGGRLTLDSVKIDCNSIKE